MTFCISQWQNNAGVLRSGVGLSPCLFRGRTMAQVRDLAFRPDNHRKCTLSLRQGSEPGVGLQGVLLSLLYVMTYYLQSTNPGSQKHDSWSPKGLS